MAAPRIISARDILLHFRTGDVQVNYDSITMHMETLLAALLIIREGNHRSLLDHMVKDQ